MSSAATITAPAAANFPARWTTFASWVRPATGCRLHYSTDGRLLAFNGPAGGPVQVHAGGVPGIADDRWTYETAAAFARGHGFRQTYANESAAPVKSRPDILRDGSKTRQVRAATVNPNAKLSPKQMAEHEARIEAHRVRVEAEMQRLGLVNHGQGGRRRDGSHFAQVHKAC